MPAQKYLICEKRPPEVYRLTLSVEAFALALIKSKPIAGFNAAARTDGRWDVLVTPATADQLNQLRQEGESRSDVVLRILGAAHGKV